MESCFNCKYFDKYCQHEDESHKEMSMLCPHVACEDWEEKEDERES